MMHSVKPNRTRQQISHTLVTRQSLRRKLPGLALCCALASLLAPASAVQAELWNINFAGRNEVNEFINVADGTDPIGMGGGTWNNVMSPTSSSTWDPDSPLTLIEANGGDSINLDWGPNGSLRDHDASLSGAALTDLNRGWFGYSNFDQTLNFTNIPAGTYDVTVYFTWRWNENSVDYQFTQGAGDDLGPKTLSPEQSTAADYADYVEGNNYVIFQDVSPVGGDLDLRVFNTSDAGISAIQISTPKPTLTVVVNSVTGMVTLKNLADQPISFDYYLLESDYQGGALDPAGWDSLDDKENGDAYGTGWDESGSVDTSQLVELNLNSQTTLAPNEWVSLGGAFDTSIFGEGQDGDLTFRFGVPDKSSLAYGDVIYVTDPAIVGDLDGDGFVGITDLNIILSAWNQNTTPGAPADPSEDGFVGIDDLNLVLGNWNAGTPPIATTIPEPGSLLLASLGTGLFFTRRRTY